MCFFCIEGTAIALSQALALGQEWDPELEQLYFFDTFYILESANPLPAIERAQTALSGVTLNPADAKLRSKLESVNAVVCRVSDLLLAAGFSANLYQTLLASPVVSRLLNIFFSITPPLDDRLLTESSALTEIFQRQIFFTADGAKFIESERFKRDSITLLENYLRWWHDHQNYHEGADLQELENFMRLLPYIFLSFAVVRKFYPTHPLLARLVNTAPKVPLGENFDMWLQRMAACHLIQTAGLEVFLPYGQKCRPVILYYLLVTKQLSENAKQRLKEAILQSGAYATDEIIPNFIRARRLFYMSTENFIMAALEN